MNSLSKSSPPTTVLDLAPLERATLATDPYEWAFIGSLFSPEYRAALATSFPRDSYKTVQGYDGEKGYSYDARSLIHMGAAEPAHVSGLSDTWRGFAADLLSPTYRAALGRLVGRELVSLPMEVNVFRYPPRAWLGAHVDLEDKLLTHVFYFNESWDERSGGCINILRSSNMADCVARVPPLVGHSVVLVRSERSWHAVSPVAPGSHQARLSMTVTFYSPGSVSTMWPPGDQTPLHSCEGETDPKSTRRALARWASVGLSVASKLWLRR